MKSPTNQAAAHSNRYYFLMYIKTGDKKYLMRILPMELEQKASFA
ncbi:hypothetical protein GCM10023310_16190 [Paenibacillus vulneris]|uniref:Uncharacterized protein n=1 Tax=Paenibacillus vulneris TaxID=1133364 RepID=A0ABW3UIF2_9BACL|nr:MULTISPECIES: hypothetical protein [unclassified Paenibacillus]MBE1446796.1 hypothetical protein [Paenibacillus sp. OAS669]